MMSLYEKAESAVAIVLMVAVVSLVFVAGVARWFGTPLVWSVDVAQLLFVWVSFLGADMALRRRSHIGIDYLVRNLPARMRASLELALGAIVVGFLLSMTVLGYRLTMLNMERQFGDSGISYAFVTAAVPVCCLLLAFTLIRQMVETAASLRSAPHPLFTGPPTTDIGHDRRAAENPSAGTVTS